MARPVCPPRFRFPQHQAMELLAAIEDLAAAVASMRSALSSVHAVVPAVVQGRTADHVDTQLQQVIVDLDVVLSHLDAAADAVEGELVAGRFGRRRHDAAMARFEHDLLRWRAGLVVAHG